MSCLDDNEAAAFVQGLMGPEAAQRVEGHLESCSTCRGLMIDFAQAFGPPPVADDTDPATPTEAPPIRRGDRLDRYVVLECVGTGGMSTVYSAYDPELDRKVALKVLRVASAEASVNEPYRQDRMLIEARAIARLSHPNVVSVFDARLLQGDLFIAMELVEGETLRQRLDRGVSGWREALALCSAAGRGLAAAHRAGIVHRDFKPENVLIGNDGRVRVADFGLATEVGASETAPIPSPSASTSSSLPQGLTRTGFVLGTPMYMAPEQMEGADPTPGGDQYSLCLVCFEALFGQRPFAAATFEDLLARRREERMLALARPRGLPRSLEDALRRGLRAEPGERWPSVDALLEALELPRSRAASWIGLGVVGAAAAVVLGARTIDTDATHCDRGSLEIAETWNPDVRRGMQARGAAGSGPELLTRLDTWSADWAEAYDRACRATWIDHVQSEALLDRRIACLQRRRRELSTLVALLLDDEPTFRGHEAIEAIDMAACADMERLLRSDGTIEPAVDQARDRVERARVHREAGHYTEALALAREGQAAADATHHPATRAEAWVELGLSLAATGEQADAVDPLAQAVAIASAAGEDDLAADAWLGLISVKSLDSSTTELLHWESFAEAAVLRVGDPPRMRVRWLVAVGAVALRAGRLDEALSLFEQAHEHVRPLADEEPLRLADVLARLAHVQLLRGELHEAERLIEDSLALRQDVLGDRHPRVGDAMQNYGGVLLEVGRFEAASRVLTQALDIAQESLGPEHPSLIGILAALGSAERRLGQTERAREHLLAVLRLREAGLGPHHVDVAATLVGLANVDYADERYLAARAGLLRALEIYGRSLAPDHPDVLDARASLANVWTDLGDHGRAEAEYRAILSAREATLGTAHPKVAMTRANLGQLLVTAGRPAEGLPLLEVALTSARASMGSEHPFVAFAENAQRDALAAIAAAAAERDR